MKPEMPEVYLAEKFPQEETNSGLVSLPYVHFFEVSRDIQIKEEFKFNFDAEYLLKGDSLL